jgi:hypothetical protein
MHAEVVAYLYDHKAVLGILEGFLTSNPAKP